MEWWAYNALLPAAVLGVQGRRRARARRHAVKVLNSNAVMWYERFRLRRWKRVVRWVQRRRRQVMLGSSSPFISLHLPPSHSTSLHLPPPPSISLHARR